MKPDTKRPHARTTVATNAAPRTRLVHLAPTLACLLAACGGASTPPPSGPQPPATLRAGDVGLHASAIQTASLGEATARQYGVARDPGTVLLVIGLRRGGATAETSMAARVTAKATTLLGQTRTVALREVRSDGFIDYVGSVEMSPPETLRFEVVARAAGAAPMTLRFQRDFFP